MRSGLESQVRKLLQDILDEDNPMLWVSGKKFVHKNFRSTIQGSLALRPHILAASSSIREKETLSVSSNDASTESLSQSLVPNLSSTQSLEEAIPMSKPPISVGNLHEVDDWIETRPTVVALV